MRHTPPASTQPPAGISPDVDPDALVARVFVQDAARSITWSEKRALSRPAPPLHVRRSGRALLFPRVEPPALPGWPASPARSPIQPRIGDADCSCITGWVAL